MGIRLSLLVVALGVLALGCGDDSDGNSAGPGVSSGDGHDAAGGDGDGDAVGDGDGDAAPDGGSGDGDAPVGVRAWASRG
ncbi:MAG: hypothetical protein OXT09_29230 [Myxococcales bacterium]|nr:hypothetical protein [Myxococcales bacterium]